MIRENMYPVKDLIFPQNVLVSVFDKEGLGIIINAIMRVNPLVRFYSTGGTGEKIKTILGDKVEQNYMSVEEFTGSPEMEGGLVKTLHPKIHAGLLAERNNPAHEQYLHQTMLNITGSTGVYFDMFIGNLYPFEDVVSKDEATSETARVNIDIGGPAMTMAAAKNWHSVAVIASPGQYEDYASDIEDIGGTNLRMRFKMAQIAFWHIGDYRWRIGDYFEDIDFDKDVKSFLKVQEE
jgi:phosphoribosylaminoimidazolecarboxamide formyltransferase / IMP cyclohydrolase